MPMPPIAPRPFQAPRAPPISRPNAPGLPIWQDHRPGGFTCRRDAYRHAANAPNAIHV